MGVPYTMSLERARQIIEEGAEATVTEPVSLGGRVRELRDFGGVVFAVIEEQDVYKRQCRYSATPWPPGWRAG